MEPAEAMTLPTTRVIAFDSMLPVSPSADTNSTRTGPTSSVSGLNT